MLQFVLLLGGRFAGLGLGSRGGGLAELLGELNAGVVGELAEELVHGVFADLDRGGLGDGVLIDAVRDGILLVLLLELLEGDEGLARAMV